MQDDVKKGARPDAATAPYGAWSSPLSAEHLSGQSYGFFDLQFNHGALYWREHKPSEGGKYALMHFTKKDGAAEAGGQSLDVRTQVHEYGGRAVLAANDFVVVSNIADHQLYQWSAGGHARKLTAIDGLRFADCVEDAARNRIICVREDHRGEGEAQNTIAAIMLEPSSSDEGQRVLVEGSDFFAYPALSPDGEKIAWVSWDHPNLPWDNTSLWVGDIDQAGEIVNRRKLNDGVRESILQPRWKDNETLYFISDRTDWWNIHVWKNGEIHVVHKRSADFAFPLWLLGENHYDFLPNGDIIARFVEDQSYALGRISTSNGALTPIPLDGGEPGGFVVGDDSIYVVVRSKTGHDILAQYDISTGETSVIRQIDEPRLEDNFISQAQAVSFNTSNGEKAYAYYYAPANPQFRAPAEDKPPLIVKMHGGPTFHTSPYLNYDIQFWTSRGFALLDVNYRGSSGFGRAFRRSLYGEWGVKDIEDAINGALYIADEGLVDRDRLLIRGSSAGGFAVLAALAFHDVFAGGGNYFGVSDLEMIAKDTHKFESHYFEHLVGPYPEARTTFIERSPINSIERLNKPLITLQGADDKVVPPNQSELIFEALKADGTPTAYLLFDDEKHGFQKAETRKRALEAELYFYGKILGFEPAGDIAPVLIHNQNAIKKGDADE
ncbi:MAG: prolyl oligopeptidase family serine peptidase [Pseudomonadota bacterium]